MKIGSLTLVFPSNDNYGAYLQGYALCKAIDQIEGFSATCLPYYGLAHIGETSVKYSWQEACCRYGDKKYSNAFVRTFKRCCHVIRELLRLRKRIGSRQSNSNIRQLRFKEFAELFQMQGVVFNRPSQLSEANVDGFIVGSDWVWYVDDSVGRRGYYGQFETDKPIFSYAASFGIQPTEAEDIARVRQFLPNFQNLSCREKEGTALIQALGYKNAHWDIDPTLLLTSKDWEGVVEKPIEDNYIALYWLPNDDQERVIEYVERVRAKFPCSKLIVLNPNPIKIRDSIQKAEIGPQDFLGYIKYARYVVTNSFHGCVFCSLFETPFSVFPRFKGDSRIQNLLDLTCMQNRMITDLSQKDPFEQSIDWLKVHERIQSRASISQDYLKTVLTTYEASVTNE